ncbi:hypothetical protein GWI33_016996 [Rhynchophorus ferrugineus]|uniref:Uncharacterized protein n=1 Tax=Rhynchophorus ferrugineus TaxID=354439 RepID=A0A834HZY0_RHYFE|nr:hypothetical protein GWI33_016996 [Rhynchophorus ferrugineus]
MLVADEERFRDDVQFVQVIHRTGTRPKKSSVGKREPVDPKDTRHRDLNNKKICGGYIQDSFQYGGRFEHLD